MQTLYRFFDKDDQLLYVGIAHNFERRLNGHYQTAAWMPLAVTCKLEHYATREEVVRREKTAIETESPIYNKQHNAVADKYFAHYVYCISPGKKDRFHAQLYKKFTEFMVENNYLKNIYGSNKSDDSNLVAWALLNSYELLSNDVENFKLECEHCEALAHRDWLSSRHGQLCDNYMLWASIGITSDAEWLEFEGKN